MNQSVIENMGESRTEARGLGQEAVLADPGAVPSALTASGTGKPDLRRGGSEKRPPVSRRGSWEGRLCALSAQDRKLVFPELEKYHASVKARPSQDLSHY